MRPLTLKVLLENLFDRSMGLEPEDHDAPAKAYRRAILKQIAAAKKAGKPFAWGREGGVAGRDREELAQRIAKRLGVKFHGFNLEHPKTNIERDNSLVMRKLRRMMGSQAGAEASRHSFLGGQGDRRYKTKRGNRFLRRMGVNPKSQENMYDASFGAQDRGQKPGLLGRAQETINKIRRAGIRRSVSDMQKQGYHVGGTIGAGHVKDGYAPQPKRKWNRDPKYDA